eukprot:SAG22_NODE_993_length_6123_cov_15.091799_6_plen_55_part_00
MSLVCVTQDFTKRMKRSTPFCVAYHTTDMWPTHPGAMPFATLAVFRFRSTFEMF